MINIRKINAGVPVGTEVPERQHYGNVGRWVEHKMREQGWNVTDSEGPDMPEVGIEIKSRKVESSSHHTVGTMSIDKIICTPYDLSPVKDKFQKQYRVHYSDEGQVVVAEGLMDFSDDYIQDKIREAYEAGRRQIIKNQKQGIRLPYIKGTEWGHFEIVQDRNSYRFRIPNHSMKKIETISKNSNIFNALFE